MIVIVFSVVDKHLSSCFDWLSWLIYKYKVGIIELFYNGIIWFKVIIFSTFENFILISYQLILCKVLCQPLVLLFIFNVAITPFFCPVLHFLQFIFSILNKELRYPCILRFVSFFLIIWNMNVEVFLLSCHKMFDWISLGSVQLIHFRFIKCSNWCININTIS